MKKSEGVLYCKKLLYCFTRSLLRQNRSFSLKSFHYFNRHLSRNRRAEKKAAASLSSSLNYQNGIFIHIYEMEGNLPLPLAFFTYTSHLHGFLHNIEDSQFQIQNYLAPKNCRWFASDCEWHSTISQIRSKYIFIFEKFLLSEKRSRWQSCCRMRMKW